MKPSHREPDQQSVLHVYKSYFPDTHGGVEQAIRQISKATLPHGFHSTIFTLNHANGPARIEAPEALVWRYPVTIEFASCPVSIKALCAFRALASTADLIHYHFPWPFADILDYLRPRATPAIVTYHSDIVRQQRLLWLYGPLMRRFLGRAAKIVATSPNYLAASSYLDQDGGRCSAVPLALDETTYPAVTEHMRKVWEERHGREFFLFVGVLRYYKGLTFLLEACQGADFTLLIAGQGPLEKELKAQAGQLGLANVIFLGFLPDEDKAALLSLCKVFVFPSHLRSEAYGISLVEAAMFGKPIISCEIGTGTSYINIDGETGLVVAPADPAALRKAMDQLHAHPEEAVTMGEAARRRFEAKFTADKMGRDYAALYRDVLSEEV